MMDAFSGCINVFFFIYLKKFLLDLSGSVIVQKLSEIQNCPESFNLSH